MMTTSLQVVHEIRNYPYPQLHLLALQSLNPSRHATAVRESYEVNLTLPHITFHKNSLSMHPSDPGPSCC